MNDTHPYKVFLLGGHDLEMLTIKQLLEGREDCVYIDKHLKWDNAFLSAYKDELSHYTNAPIYGIELQEDIPAPKHYHAIDHHYQKEDMPCALEQVAAILGVTLNRYQLLVASNDKGYIPAMLSIAATQEEIEAIRRNDRLAQGVSPEDEKKAEASIAHHLSRHGSLTLVHSLTPCFSCIVDRLFPYHSLLVYNDQEWTFYGEGKNELVAQMREDIHKKKLYFGGGANGFIGSVEGAYTKDEIHSFVEQISIKYEQV